MAAERSVVYVRNVCVSRLRWSPSFRCRAVFQVPRLQKPLGCGNEKDPCAVAVMRRSAIVGHVPRKISAACSQIRDRGIVHAHHDKILAEFNLVVRS